jgi:hypothetical protein
MNLADRINESLMLPAMQSLLRNTGVITDGKNGFTIEHSLN